MSLLKVCSCLCCCFIVIINVVAILLGSILTMFGCLFTWGFAVLSSTPAMGFVSSALSSMTSMLRSSFGIDIDVLELIGGLGQITGSMGAVFLALGICLIVLGCIGCCGACCSNKACLLVYAISVAVIMLAQACIVAIWFFKADLLKQLAKQAMTDSIGKFTGISSKNIQTLVQNIVQIFVGCCGVTNGTDFHTMSPNWARTYTYNSSGYSFTYNLTYPLTCCKFNLTSFSPVDEFCSYNNTNTNTSWYQVGCYDKIFKQIDQYFSLNYIFYALGGIIGLQLVLALGAGVIMSALSAKNKVKPM